MAKCRMLIAENQDLGKQLSQGRIAQLEAELALQKKYNEELKCSQDGMMLAFVFFGELCCGKAMMACTKPQKIKKDESKRLRRERDQIKFADLRFE